MKAVRWNPESLIIRHDGLQAAVDGMVRAAERGERLRIQVERSESQRILGQTACGAATKFRFREGCIKTVETGIWPLPQKGSVMAEIHRRLDDALESDCASAAWRTRLTSIYDFAGAWTLAARLMRAGLKVSVIEADPGCESWERDGERVDVEILIPIAPAGDV